MPSTRRIAGIAVAVLALLILVAGTIFTVRGMDTSDTTAAAGDTGVAGSTSSAISEATATGLAVPVEGREVVLDTLVLFVNGTGQAAANQRVDLTSQIGGRVSRVAVRENDQVAAGALIMALDTTEFLLNLRLAEARRRQAEASYREITLMDDRISDPVIRAQRDTAARLKAGLDESAINLQKARFEFERSRLTAPFAGRVADVKVVPGQQVGAGTAVVTLVALDPIKIELNVSESDIGLLSIGGAARVTMSALAREQFEGRIQTINPIVDPSLRTARVTVNVSNPRARILPGMYASALLPAQKFPNRVLIPREAVLERQGRNVVLVFLPNETGSDGRVDWRYVNLGRANNELYEIVEEGPETGTVKPGEIVLTSGHYTLHHDTPIRIVARAGQDGR